MALTPSQRSQRSKIAAATRDAQGLANTRPAREAFERKFLDQVDPDRVLPEAERIKRAEAARKAHFASMALKSSIARRKAKRKPQAE